ncbi:MAG: response regulator [Lachnospiraceae bacterium]|nr:response regulator [Lachnospiraceae bacterium]
MWILVNCFLMILGSITLVVGINFFLQNREASYRTSFYILLYCVTSALWCIIYGLIGFIDDFELASLIRVAGIFSIDAFLINEVFFVSRMIKKGRRITTILRAIIVALSIIDFLAYSNRDLDIYVKIGNWTTWYSNAVLSGLRAIHSHFVALAFLTTLITGLVWARSNTLKRQRRFVRMLFIANFILLVFSIPDTFLPIFGIHAVPTSGIGAAGCALVIWYAATRLNSVDIRTGNLIDKLYDFIDVGVIVFNTDHRIALANPYARRMAGGNINSCRIEDLFELEEGESGDIFTGSLNKVYNVNKKGRDKKTYSLQMNAVTDEFGDPYCYMCIFMDISQEVHLIEKLEQANNAKTNFLTSMSHEIRTPINAVVGFNEMISRESNDPLIKDYTANIERAAHHLLTIINDLLDMEQITVGKITINPEHYDLSEVLRDVYTIHSLKAREKGLEIKLLSAPDIPRFLYGDRVRLQQIIINLVTNAIKYTREGSVTVEADYWRRDEDLMDLIIRVTDTGVGIREEDRERLFDVFERFDLDSNKYTEGTGLGLSLTKSLVELMGGTISVESEYGKGSCFTVSVPQIISDIDSPGLDIEEVVKEKGGYAASFVAPSASILVVDDNEMNIKVAEGLIAPLKIKTEAAPGGYEMLDLIGRKHYDLILLDHLMPKMDGITALKRMREDKSHPNQDTPVIVMTANAIRGMREKFLAEGFTDFISKPIEPVVLEDMLRMYLPDDLIEEAPEGEHVSESVSERGLACNDILPEVEGIDISAALKTSTDSKMVVSLMKTFCQSSVSDLGELEDNYHKGVVGNNDEALELYNIKVHALKNSAALIGAMDLSVMARELEYASAEGNRDYVRDHHEEFIKTYEDISYALTNTLLRRDMEEKEAMDGDSFMRNVELAKQAMENYDTLALNDIIVKLTNADPPSEEMKACLTDVREAVRDFDRDRFFAAVDRICHIAREQGI